MSLFSHSALLIRQNIKDCFSYNVDVVDAKEQQSSGDDMEYNIYMDVFLLFNFIMNLLVLQCSVWILRAPIEKKRSFFSAMVGSLSSFLWFYGILMKNSSGIFMENETVIWFERILSDHALNKVYVGVRIGYVLGGIGTAAVMTYLAFGREERKAFFSKFLCLYLVAFSMEGAIRFTGSWKGCGAVVLVSYFLGKERRENPNILQVELHFKGKTKKLKGFYDTGNQLQEPITGKMVHVASYQEIKELLPLSYQQAAEGYFQTGILENTKVTKYQMYEFTFLSYHSIGKETGQLLGIRMDSAMVWNRVGKWTEEKAVIALTDQKILLQGRCGMILNGRLEL